MKYAAHATAYSDFSSFRTVFGDLPTSSAIHHRTKDLVMSIMFDKGDGSKDPKGRQGWLKDSHDHLTSEVTVTRLIQKAAKALEQVEIIEVQIWCSAAWGVADSGVLRG